MDIVKTNAIRKLDSLKINYTFHTIGAKDALSGVEVANILGLDPDIVFKTLVTVGASRKNYVFVIPVAFELDLKKAAKVVREKSIEMIKSKELLSLTGYIHGGCSPIGMKKLFPTYFDESSILYDTIIFNGGHIGYHVEMNIMELKKVMPFEMADLLSEK